MRPRDAQHGGGLAHRRYCDACDFDHDFIYSCFRSAFLISLPRKFPADILRDDCQHWHREELGAARAAAEEAESQAGQDAGL